MRQTIDRGIASFEGYMRGIYATNPNFGLHAQILRAWQLWKQECPLWAYSLEKLVFRA